jgi:hypothetical protein
MFAAAAYASAKMRHKKNAWVLDIVNLKHLVKLKTGVCLSWAKQAVDRLVIFEWLN